MVADRLQDGGEWDRGVVLHWLESLQVALGQRLCLSQEGIAYVLATPDDTHRVRRAVERGLAEANALLSLLGAGGPTPPCAVLAFDLDSDYHTFISMYYPPEGSWASSGGLYIAHEASGFPVVAIRARHRPFIDEILGHELTHHVLAALRLPMWLQEGLAGLVQDRVAETSSFWVDTEMVARQRACWNERPLDEFWSGDSFESPHDELQRLSYHLAQWLVRKELSSDAPRFCGFVRSCAENGDDWAATEHFGQSKENWARTAIGLPHVDEPRLRANTPLLPHPHVLRFDVTLQDWAEVHRIAEMSDAEAGPLGPAEIRLMEFGVAYVQGDHRLPCAWCGLRKVEEHPSGVVLWFPPAILHIPNRAFANEVDRLRVLAIARLFVPA
jgi:hypothetical protein